jgi:uncharacterized RDD family membrane protein YckC
MLLLSDSETRSPVAALPPQRRPVAFLAGLACVALWSALWVAVWLEVVLPLGRFLTWAK